MDITYADQPHLCKLSLILVAADRGTEGAMEKRRRSKRHIAQAKAQRKKGAPVRVQDLVPQGVGENSIPIFALAAALIAFAAECGWAIFFFLPQVPSAEVSDGPTVSIAAYYSSEAESLNEWQLQDGSVDRQPLARVVAQPSPKGTLITLTVEEQFVDPVLSIEGAVFAIPVGVNPIEINGNACLPIAVYPIIKNDTGPTRQVTELQKGKVRYIECHISHPAVDAIGEGEHNTIGVSLQFVSRTAHQQLNDGYSSLALHFDDGQSFEFANDHTMISTMSGGEKLYTDPWLSKPNEQLQIEFTGYSGDISQEFPAASSQAPNMISRLISSSDTDPDTSMYVSWHSSSSWADVLLILWPILGSAVIGAVTDFSIHSRSRNFTKFGISVTLVVATSAPVIISGLTKSLQVRIGWCCLAGALATGLVLVALRADDTNGERPKSDARRRRTENAGRVQK
jgi:hypothetical protein